MNSRTKKRLLNTLRIAACVAALAIVVNGVTLDDRVSLTDGAELTGRVTERAGQIQITMADGSERSLSVDEIATDERGDPEISYGLLSAWSRSIKWLLGAAFLIHFIVILPQALRFYWLLRAQSISVGYWECVKLSFAGNFLNFATPMGSNLGDVFKAYFVAQHTPHKTEAVATVVLDRVVGLASLLLVVVAFTMMGGADSRLAPIRPYMLPLLVAGVMAVVIYFSPALRKRLPRRWLDRLPMREHLVRLDASAHKLASAKMIVLGAVLLTIGLQATAIGAYFVVAIAMGLDATASNVMEYYTYFYSGILIQALPGPPQGLGTVELSYRYFFAPFGSPSQILCMAFVIRLVALSCSLPGLIITLTGSHKPSEIQKGFSEPDSASVEQSLPVRELAAP